MLYPIHIPILWWLHQVVTGDYEPGDPQVAWRAYRAWRSLMDIHVDISVFNMYNTM